VLDLSPDELLTTTRSVRRRLDLTRPVERATIEECLALAQQAPTGGNAQTWAFVVVTDPETRRALADVYRRGWERYLTWRGSAMPSPEDDERRALRRRIGRSAAYLAEHLHEVPVHVVPCIRRYAEDTPFTRATAYGSILPAAWSFMLAARTRGLGCTLTTIHLIHEEEAAEVLGVPHGEVAQVALIPVAHTRGAGFRPAPREPLGEMIHWERW
jgi:nitroreductase